jgi:hypothetical protein
MGVAVWYLIEARGPGGPWQRVLNPPELQYYRQTDVFCALGNDMLYRAKIMRIAAGQTDPTQRTPPPEPLVPARGWPDDIDALTDEAATYEGGGDDFSPSGPWRCNCFTLAELLALESRIPPGEVTDVLMPFMQRLGFPAADVRLLLAFD